MMRDRREKYHSRSAALPSSKPKQSRELHCEDAIREQRESAECGIGSLVVHDVQIASWLILPAEADVRAERIDARVVLSQGLDEHPGRHRVDDPQRGKPRGEASLGQVDPVDRDTRLEREPRRYPQTAGITSLGPIPAEEPARPKAHGSGEPYGVLILNLIKCFLFERF